MLKNNTVYIIDFQDARWGPPLYDLVSLLSDSVDLETQLSLECQNYYLNHPAWQSTKLTQIRQAFSQQFNLTCTQRLLKALGTYGYQITVRGNLTYKQYIPGTLCKVVSALQALDKFPYIQSIVEQK